MFGRCHLPAVKLNDLHQIAAGLDIQIPKWAMNYGKWSWEMLILDKGNPQNIRNGEIREKIIMIIKKSTWDFKQITRNDQKFIVML